MVSTTQPLCAAAPGASTLLPVDSSCSAASAERKVSSSTASCNTFDSQASQGSDFSAVSGLEPGLRDALQRLFDDGIQLPAAEGVGDRRYSLLFGGEVPHDGNCLFAAAAIALRGTAGDAAALRARAVARFREECESGMIGSEADTMISNLYAPDTSCGWGVHFIQEAKLLLPVAAETNAASQIEALTAAGMEPNTAAESVYRELCTPVNDRASWAAYMSIDGAAGNAHRVVTLRYVEEGLLGAEVSGNAAFGDDLAIEALATDLGRNIFVVQAHGSDADSGADGALFFLPHAPRAAAGGAGCAAAPLFLLMKGAGWCLAGADHYSPLITRKLGECARPAAFVL